MAIWQERMDAQSFFVDTERGLPKLRQIWDAPEPFLTPEPFLAQEPCLTPEPFLAPDADAVPGSSYALQLCVAEPMLHEYGRKPEMQWTCVPCDRINMKAMGQGGALVLLPVQRDSRDFGLQAPARSVQQRPNWTGPSGEDSSARAEVCGASCMVEVSIGSVGHPYNCAEACKYVSKTRGCKDGASCIRCHLCKWKKKGAARA
mmetsp:Transcript_9310/g.16968  ORF Transcript_9310/g.16968 Transcript_9310/m.16968 type:complete len:203 (-) Transcript_9310:156-764(-)